MKPLTLTAVALCAGALGAWTPSAGAALPEPVRATNAAADTFDSVLAEYDKAVATHAKAMEEADRETRRALRKNKPINDFWPRFSELASANDGRSLLWLAQNVRQYRAIKSSQRKAALAPIIGALVEHHSGAKWFEDVFGVLQLHRSTLGLEATRGYLDAAIAKVESPNVKAAGLFTGYQIFLKEDPKTSKAYGDALAAAAPGGYWGTRYRSTKGAVSLEVGKLAPDFAGRTIDGKELALSDYRGQVVLIDFFGFW
ncbi:MAG: hypothetical protein AAFU73_11985 [Planctomycetota bacterium]